MRGPILPSRFSQFVVVFATVALAFASQAETTPSPDAAAPSGAVPVIDTLQAELLGVMKDADEIGFEGRYERLQSIVTETFDLAFMAEKSVGRHWKKLSEEEKQRWLSSFHDMTAATYAGRFEGFSGQHFEVLGEEPAKHDTVLVRARLVSPDDDDVRLNYRLHELDGQWRIIDVYLNGTVSELALRRSEYASVLKRDGFEKLIATIVGKTQEIAEASLN